MADHIYHNSKSLAEVLHEIKNELRDFITTRVDLLRAEMQDKFEAWKAALPMMVVGAVFMVGAFFALTFGLVALFAVLIGGEYQWVWGAAVVLGLYALIGGGVGWAGAKQMRAEGLKPDRTLRVLKQDQLWVKNEARAS